MTGWLPDDQADNDQHEHDATDQDLTQRAYQPAPKRSVADVQACLEIAPLPLLAQHRSDQRPKASTNDWADDLSNDRNRNKDPGNPADQRTDQRERRASLAPTRLRRAKCPGEKLDRFAECRQRQQPDDGPETDIEPPLVWHEVRIDGGDRNHEPIPGQADHVQRPTRKRGDNQKNRG